MPSNFPAWLHVLSIGSLIVAGTCALIIAVDEMRRPQHMWIMNLVWPLTALFGSLAWLPFYWLRGRGPEPSNAQSGEKEEQNSKKGFVASVAKATSHCGAGCTLGDIIAEWLAFFVPAVAVAFGWGPLFSEKMFAVWILDFMVAFLLGMAFQYFTIVPMRQLSFAEGVKAAAKADAASIAAWQVGMYGFMAVAQFLWFRRLYGHIAAVSSPEFWFAMQIAMICGFFTSYPVNWLLVKHGIKEKM
ncbi:MAG: DUF4396 domain-containing protein [Proteobacteria bacterium]|nr:DUF4396 domain-containing protein [Pseudomonadota bacterium]